MNRTLMTRPGTWIGLAGWLLVMAGVTYALLAARQRTLAELDNEQGQRQWQQWREANDAMRQTDGPVARRPVRSREAPGLILLRDHFMAVLASTLLVASFLYGFLAFTLWGSFRRSPPRQSQTKLSMPDVQDQPAP